MVTSCRPGSTWRSSRCFERSEMSTPTDAPSRASVVTAFHQRHVRHGLRGRSQDSSEPGNAAPSNNCRRPGSTWRSSRCFERSEASTPTDAPSRVSFVTAFHRRHVGHGLRGRRQDSSEPSRPGSTWRSSRCFERSEASTLTDAPSRVSVVTAFHQRHVRHGLRGRRQEFSEPGRPGSTWQW